MASNTPNLNLLKKDPVTDGNDTFNIQTMLNDNWDKIDTAVKHVQDELDSVSVPPASTTQAGIVQLTNAINSTSETLAPTAKALKTVSDTALSKTGGTVTGSINISDPNAVPLSLHRPGNKRWISHLEAPSSSGNTGGRLHLSPSKTVDAADWDFDKGMAVNADTGRINVKNGIEGGDLIVYNNKTWLNAQTNFGGAPSHTLSIGDSDTGLNWFADGGVDFFSNGSKAVALHNGTFKYYDNDGSAKVLKDEINNLKQSGVNVKARLAAAINAKSVGTAADASFDTLVNNISQIKALTITGTPNVNPNNIGRDGNGNYLYQLSNNTTVDWTFTLPNVNFVPSYVSLNIGNILCIYSDGRSNGAGVVYPPTNFISSNDNGNAGLSFAIVSLSQGAFTLRVTSASRYYASFRFYLGQFTAIGL